MNEPKTSAPAFAIAPPIEPMLAKLPDTLPEGSGFLYEPKWDGFRAIVFRHQSDLYFRAAIRDHSIATFPSFARRFLPTFRSTACWTARS